MDDFPGTRPAEVAAPSDAAVAHSSSPHVLLQAGFAMFRLGWRMSGSILAELFAPKVCKPYKAVNYLVTADPEQLHATLLPTRWAGLHQRAYVNAIDPNAVLMLLNEWGFDVIDVHGKNKPPSEHLASSLVHVFAHRDTGGVSR